MDRIDWENPVSDHPLNQGLVSWWLAGDENPYWGGPKYFDLLYETNAALSGPTWGTRINPALGFDGTDDYCELDNAVASHVSKPSLPITIEAAVYVASLGAARSIFSNDYKATAYTGVNLILLSTGEVYAAYGDNTGTGSTSRRSGFTGAGVATAGSLLHIVATIRGATDMSISVNGISRSVSYSGSGGAMAYSTGAGRIGYSAFSGFFSGSVHSVRLYGRDVPQPHISTLYDEFRQGYPGVLNRLPKRFFFSLAGGGEVSITPNDATHAHTAESPAITQVHAISPADATHGHTVESPAITQVHAISPSDATHAHTAESPTVTQVHSLAPTDATHGHTAESPSVSEGVAVFPADALHGHTAESPALTQVHIVSPADALHGHAAESPLITQVHVISPADALHAHYADAAVVSTAGQVFVLATWFPTLVGPDTRPHSIEGPSTLFHSLQ